MKITVLNPDGTSEEDYEAIEGWSLMEVLKEYQLPLKAECGGACACATCHVYIEAEWKERLAPPSEEEEDLLDQAPDVQENSRLACQIIMDSYLHGLRLRIAPQTD
jgi:2Fe-2S ferredoxin